MLFRIKTSAGKPMHKGRSLQADGGLWYQRKLYEWLTEGFFQRNTNNLIVKIEIEYRKTKL